MNALYLLLLVCTVPSGNSLTILNLTSSSNTVSASNNISVVVVSDSTGILKLQLSSLFLPFGSCSMDGIPLLCTQTNSNGVSIITFANANAGIHSLQLGVTNPAYVDSFSVNSLENNTFSTNQAVIKLTALVINCSAFPASLLVGAVTQAKFILTNLLLPAGSTIEISVPLVKLFNNFFLESPSCASNAGDILTCSVSTIFSTQVLTISTIPTAANMQITISSVRNPPFNSSLFVPLLSIKNAEGKSMQTCTVSVTAPTTLQTSQSISLLNWASAVGATSTVQFFLLTYFPPFCSTTFIQLLYPNTLSFAGDTPFNSSINVFTETNPTVNNNTITFTATLTNPSSVQLLPIYVFVLCNSTLFSETIVYNSFTLTPLNNVSVSYTQSDSRTLQLSVYTFSVQLPSTVNNPILEIGISRGAIQCNLSLSFQGKLSSFLGCSAERMTLYSVGQLSGSVSLSVTIRNPFAIKINPMYFAVQGTFNVSMNATYIPNNESSQLVNNNPRFNAETTLSWLEGALNATYTRVLILSLPLDMQLGDVAVSCSSCTVVSLQIQSNNTINLTVTTGPSATVLTFTRIVNPRRYTLSREFSITAYDTLGVLSSVYASTITPEYTPTTAALQFALTDTTIDARTTLAIIIIPSLAYISSPQVSIELSDTLLLEPCDICTPTSAHSTTVMFSSFINLSLSVQNSGELYNQSIYVAIFLGPLKFEEASISYTLEPIKLRYAASFTGVFGDSGTIIINILNAPTKALSLKYSGEKAGLSGVVCVGCNETYLQLEGVVTFVQSFIMRVTYEANSNIYAFANISLQYICAPIPGCKICSGVTCKRCFDSSLSPFSLLYNGNCLLTCPLSTYSNTITCLPCPDFCLSCLIVGCEECALGKVVFNGQCVPECPPEYETKSGKCVPRPPLCVNCSLCVSDANCSLCIQSYSLLNNLCYAVCPTLYYSEEGYCLVAPATATFYPFAFVGGWALFILVLLALRHQEKNILVVQNAVAVGGILEIGTVVFTLVETYFYQRLESGFAQILLLILFLSKLFLTFFFLLYFSKVLSQDSEFTLWKQNHTALYRILLLLSSFFSIQLIRTMYSRLLPISSFYAKFSSSKVIRAMRNLSLIHLFTFVAPVLYFCVSNIRAEKGFATLLLLTSLETALLECTLTILLVLSHFAEPDLTFQSHRVSNIFDEHEIVGATVKMQAEEGGSMQQILSYGVSFDELQTPQLSQSFLWTKTNALPELKEEGEVEQQSASATNNMLRHPTKKKIIEEWRSLQKQLPNPWTAINNKRGASFLTKSTPKISKPDSSPPRPKSIKEITFSTSVHQPNFNHLKPIKKMHYHITKEETFNNPLNIQNKEAFIQKQNIFEKSEDEEIGESENYLKGTDAPSSIIKAETLQEQSAKGEISTLLYQIDKERYGKKFIEKEKKETILEFEGNEESFQLQSETYENAERKDEKFLNKIKANKELIFNDLEETKNQFESNETDNYVNKIENMSEMNENETNEKTAEERQTKLLSRQELETKNKFRQSSRRILSKDNFRRYREDSYEGYDIKMNKIKSRKVNKKTESVYLQRLSLQKNKPSKPFF